MEEVLSLVVFGVGAALGIKAVEIARGGLRPVLREAMKGGMAAGDTARSLFSVVGGRQGEAKTAPPTGRTRPRKIQVVKEQSPTP